MKINATHWQQLSELLDTALELGQEERLNWLASLPEEMIELKPALQELLTQASHIETADFLRKPPDFVAALMSDYSHMQWAEQEFQINKVIGAYRLLRELGSGGMGVVWLAERIDGKLKRQVALKFPYAGPNQRQLAERLKREREILASLEHPNIARLYDADVTSSGQPFLVLEYIDGVPINEYCDQHNLSIDERLKLFQQVLDAVRYAHSHLVIHRDLKPSNILVTGDGIAHLLDFGIAKLAVDGQVNQTALTQISGRALTPDYASPEQLAGEPVTTTSDVYSLGVLLYELLTGNRPYRLQRHTPRALEEAIEKAIIALPSHVDITDRIALNRRSSVRQLKNVLSGELDTLILKALKGSPAERYSSADALLDDVRRYVQQQPILAQPDSQWYRARKFIARNQLVVASTSAIALALIIGSGAALWQAHQAALQRDRAVASAARSEAVTDFLQLMVTDVADADEPITMQQLIARSEDIANRTYTSDASQQAAILEVLGNYHMEIFNPEKASDAFDKALAIEEKSPDEDIRARLLCASAMAQFMLGNHKLAQQRMETGIRTASKALYVQATCLEYRAYFKNVQGDLEGSLGDLKYAQELLLKSGINKPQFTVSLMSDMADAYTDMGRYSEAGPLFAKAVELLNRLGRGETTTASSFQNSWGMERASGGDEIGALKHYDIALEIARRRGMNSEQDIAQSVNRAIALIHLSRNEEAIVILRRSAERGHNDGMVLAEVSAKQGLITALLALGRTTEAKEIMDKILPMIGREIPDRGPYVRSTVIHQGLLAMKQQRYQEAVQCASKVIDALRESKVSSNYLSHVLRMRGEAYLAQKNTTSALLDATEAWNIGHSVEGEFPFSDASGDAALLLAKIHRTKNENDEAHKWATIAYQQLQGSVGAEHPSTLEAKQLASNSEDKH